MQTIKYKQQFKQLNNSNRLNKQPNKKPNNQTPNSKTPQNKSTTQTNSKHQNKTTN